MQDKYVRRRRAVLAIFVVVVLVVLVSIFGEAQSSPLHPVEQGIAKVTRPIGKGASEVVSPVRGIGHWVSSTLRAKSQNAGLRRRTARLDRELSETGIAVEENTELRGMLALTQRLGLAQDGPKYADVVTYDPAPGSYYLQIGIDRGSEDGIKTGDPVIGQYGLVGKVTKVGPTSATVSGLSSPEFGVYVQINDPSHQGGTGTLLPEPGHLLRLQVNYVATTSQIASGDSVVTATYSVPNNPSVKSPYPPGIPVGVVAGYDFNQQQSDGTVNVTPSVNMRNLSEVEVLTAVKST